MKSFEGLQMVGKCISLYRTGLLTNGLRFVSWFGDGVWIPVVLTILVAAFFWYKKERIFAAVLAITPLVGQIAKSLLKNFFQVPRPAAYGCEVLTTYGDKYSFPSGHTIFYTIFFGLLAYYAVKHLRSLWAKALFTFSTLMIILVSYSRIYLGAHWYLDVIGGYVVGGALLAVSIMIYEYYVGSKNANR